MHGSIKSRIVSHRVECYASGSTKTVPTSGLRSGAEPVWLLAQVFVCLLSMTGGLQAVGGVSEVSRPNVLWITSEDNGPHFGCYGDRFADTPHVDRLATRGLIYLNCWSTAPVCAPARTALISGMYPTSLGAQHMRSLTGLPAGFSMYPQYLRAAGYYCTNNSKEDYNLAKPGQVWDESSRRAHWKNRRPGQPFFAVFNITVSHESRIRQRPHVAIHDAAKVRVPDYHPDTPQVRQDWAQYYDKLTEMDGRVGQYLCELEQAGLADDTIVFYYGDHGAGMPRSKRWPYNSGLSVPLVIHVPEKFRQLAPAEYQPGGQTDRLVGFVDFAPTLLSLCGIRPPDHFQGHAFMGPFATPEQPYLHGFRGRMDERYDMVRTVRDKRFIYIRNYMPHKIYGQHVDYMFQTPTTRVWKELYDADRLTPPRTFFWESKPPEELYDLAHDVDEVRNLAAGPEHRQVLQRFRQAQREFVLRIRDVGFLPEHEIHARSAGSTPYEMARQAGRYPLEKILATAETASSLNPSQVVQSRLIRALADDDSAVRYWASLGLLMRGSAGVLAARVELRSALEDRSSSVRVVAAQALCQHGNDDDREQALDQLVALSHLGRNGIYISMLALNALDELDRLAAGVRDVIAELPRQDESVGQRMRNYVARLIDKTLQDLDRPHRPQ